MDPKNISRRHLLHAGGLSLFAGCSAWSKPKKNPQNIELDHHSWTHPYHDAANTNHAPKNRSPSTFSLTHQWRVSNISTYATVSDGQTIYTVLRKQSQDALCQLNTTTGTPNWTFQPKIENARNINIGLPTLSQTTVYVNVQFRNGSKTTSRIYALNRQDGSPQWHTEITANAVIRLHKSGIAIISQQGPDISLIEAVDATTGEKLWEFPQKESSFLGKKKKEGYQERWIPATTIVGNRLYIPVVEGNGTEIYVLHIESGEVQKQFTVPVRVEFALAAANGLLYGTTHSLIPGTTITTGVYAIDPQKERLQWATVTTDDVYWLGVSNKIVYFADDDGMRSLDAMAGTELWHENSEWVYPSVIGNHVLLSKPGSNRLTVTTQRTGRAVAEIPLRNFTEIQYILSDKNSIYIVKRNTLQNMNSHLYKFS